MKCLSIIQPYATLIAIGAKRIETRSWSTPYRGPRSYSVRACGWRWCWIAVWQWSVLRTTLNRAPLIV